MADKEILEFIYARLIHVYGENVLWDYMLRLQGIIDNTDENSNSGYRD
jgi:hypothetical protein